MWQSGSNQSWCPSVRLWPPVWFLFARRVYAHAYREKNDRGVTNENVRADFGTLLRGVLGADRVTSVLQCVLCLRLFQTCWIS
jgi:hypothetical protein